MYKRIIIDFSKKSRDINKKNILSDDDDLEFCYDTMSNDVEHSFTDELSCLDAGFLWSNEELKNVRTAAFNSENPLAHLIVTFLLETGIRVSELCSLNIHDVDFKDKSARVVGGKGNKDRMVLYTDQTDEVLNCWLVLRNKINLVDDDALLVNSKGKRITPRGIQKMMDRIAEDANISKKRLSPHVLRHNFATGLLERGADIVSIQRLLGHANIQTTRVYLEINDQTLREVYTRAQSNLERIEE